MLVIQILYETAALSTIIQFPYPLELMYLKKTVKNTICMQNNQIVQTLPAV